MFDNPVTVSMNFSIPSDAYNIRFHCLDTGEYIDASYIGGNVTAQLGHFSTWAIVYDVPAKHSDDDDDDYNYYLHYLKILEQKKAAALSFSGGGLYISLKISTRANSRIVAIEEFPGLTTIIAKNRIRLIGYDRQYKIRVCKECGDIIRTYEGDDDSTGSYVRYIQDNPVMCIAYQFDPA